MGEAVQIMPKGETQMRLKTNLTIWVLYASDAFRLHISHELSRCSSVSIEMMALQTLEVVNLANFSPPDLIFVETGQNWAQKIVELQSYEAPEMNQDNHEASLIVFGDESDSGALKIALRMGAADFVSHTAHIEGLLPLLSNVAEEKVVNRHLGELWVLMNTKGGAGASTIALNSAIKMAQQHSGQVLLLDLDLQFGVINDYLSIQPTYGLADALANVSDLDEVALNTFVTKHKSGLHVLSFKRENSQENFEKAKHLTQLLPLLREHYPYVMVDLSQGLDRVFSPVLLQATKVVLIAQQNLASIKNSSQIIRLLSFEFGLNKDQVEVMINRYEKRQSIRLKEIQETLGDITLHTVPNDFNTALESANLGKPFIQSKKSSAIAKAIGRFVDALLPEPETKKSWLKRLFS